MAGNKIIRKNAVDNVSDDFRNFDYGELKYKKIYNAHMIFTGDLEKRYENAEKMPAKFLVSVKRSQKVVEDKIIDYLKTHYTKEDIKRILKRDI